MRNLVYRNIELDEIWGFAGKKRVRGLNDDPGLGDVWTFMALDRETKIVPSFVVGKRDRYHANVFMEDLAARLRLGPQLSSDALAAYRDAVERGFGAEVDYRQVVKTYAVVDLNRDAASRYSPAEVVSIDKSVVQGFPDLGQITTSHVEKQNHTVRCMCGA